MRVQIRYLTYEIAKSFGSAEKSELLQLPSDAKYGELLDRFKGRIMPKGDGERLMDSLVFICDGRPLISIKDELVDSGCTILVGYADTGG